MPSILKAVDMEEFSKDCLSRVRDIVNSGVLHLDDEERPVDTKDLVELIYRISQLEIKRPHNVDKPEDFTPKKTRK